MKNPPPNLSAVLSALVVLSCLSVLFAQPSSGVTLESVADHVRVPETRYAPASFTESCAMLEATIRQALVHAEHPDANTLSRRVVLKATTAPEGARAFTAADCTLRELLSRFASTWNISASFSGNQILLSRK